MEGREPLGQVVRIPRLKQAPFASDIDSVQIVGVVRDTLSWDFTTEVRPELYLPFTVSGRADRLVILTQSDPAGITKAVLSQVYAVDREQPVTNLSTIETLVRDEIYAETALQPRALLGVCRAGIDAGDHRRLRRDVQRRGTTDARDGRADGAGSQSWQDRRIGREAWRGVPLAGIALGLAGSFLTARLLSNQVWKVSTFDPISFGAVSLILLVAGLQACFWPARRAARIDPLTALRQE